MEPKNNYQEMPSLADYQVFTTLAMNKNLFAFEYLNSSISSIDLRHNLHRQMNDLTSFQCLREKLHGKVIHKYESVLDLESKLKEEFNSKDFNVLNFDDLMRELGRSCSNSEAELIYN